MLPKKDIVRNNFMTYKHFPAQSFNHLIQPSPRIAKLKSLNGVLRGQLPPNIWFPTPVPTTPPPPPHHNVYALPSPINTTTMIRQNTKFPLTARSPIIKISKKLT